MLTQESLDKILEVLEKMKVFYGNGLYSLEEARHNATKEVAKKYDITYQTMEDGYRRRLGLKNIHEFHIMLEEWIKGDAKSLISLLETHTDKANHMRIHEFFDGDKTLISNNKTDLKKPILIYLSNDVYNHLIVISKQGKKAAEWLSEKCEVMINDEYLNYVKNEIGKLTEEQKKKLLDKLL
ncbi:MAG: hypothetical protein NTY36_08835 [Deltaproteobacteria bacterium]|nr:hypothetical protein [Deltaproteobacteria bacterium]